MKFVLDGRDFVGTKPGPKVVIIDSGVHATHPHVQGVTAGISIDAAGLRGHDYVDRLGHGTAVAAVLREKAPAAELLCVKVFDSELSTTGDALVAALQWAREQQAQIVNLSLGTVNAEREAALEREVELAAHQGMLIVSAAPTADARWLPGALAGVIAVEMDMELSRDVCEITFTADGRTIARASGYPRPIPGVPVERNLKGVSFSVANVSGLIARAWPDWRHGRSVSS